MKEYKEDLTGKKFGRLTVVSFAGRKRNNHNNYTHPLWSCMCDCGTPIEVKESYLKCGDTKSCGCLSKDFAQTLNRTHSLSNTKQHRVWTNMKMRCLNSKNTDYEYYGGRGITLDENWKDFNNFWADMGGDYSDDLTLDRIDVNGNYCKDNCQWIPQPQQSRNQRKKKSNKSGVNGVNFRKDLNLYSATWSDITGKGCSKSFSVSLYGKELAFFMACEYREQMINLLNLQGVGYSENHGK